MNCLVTKLKATVSNPDLPKLGELRIEYNPVATPSQNSQRARLAFTSKTEVHVLNGTFLDDSLSDTGLTSKDITSETDVYVSNGATLVISDKYKLRVLNISSTTSDENKYFNLADVAFCTSLTNLAFNYSLVEGDLDMVKNLTKITSLNISNSKVKVGDISSLSKMKDLQYFNFYYTNITGDCEQLIKDIWIANGRVSSADRPATQKSVYFEGTSSRTPKITFQGRTLTGSYQRFTWDAEGNVSMQEG